MLRRFKRRFWQPPRAHGDVIEDRTVSFLELFYDLVYVVVIARASHTLVEHISWRGFAEFAVIFGLIWIAWLNGTLYYDLHGREEGRTRTFVFIQMMLLALLAVFTADAAGEGGSAFAIVYALFLLVLTWLWYSVRRQDADEYMALTKRYLIGMVVITIAMAASAALPDEDRMLVWAAVVVGYLAAAMLLGRSGDGMRFGSYGDRLAGGALRPLRHHRARRGGCRCCIRVVRNGAHLRVGCQPPDRPDDRFRLLVDLLRLRGGVASPSRPTWA